jgi:hypothetical protein
VCRAQRSKNADVYIIPVARQSFEAILPDRSYMSAKQIYSGLCKISGFHGGDYEEAFFWYVPRRRHSSYSGLALSGENVDQDSVYRHIEIYPTVMLLVSTLSRIQ